MPFSIESTGRYWLMPPVEASATADSSTPDRDRRGALGLGGVVEPAPAGRGVRAAGVGEDRAQRIQPAALLADEHRRRGRSRVGEARRADRVLGVAHEQPEVAASAGLDPARDPGGPEAGGQARVRARGRARARARAPSASGRTAAAGRLGRPVAEHVFARAHVRSFALGLAEHHVQVLHRLRGGPLPQVVDRRQHDELARVLV